MDTKLKGDIAEQAAILQALKRGWGVLKTIGDRLPYDLVFDVDGVLIRVQVKAAWFQEEDDAYVVDNRRTKTNRRIMKRQPYESKDFDFALIYISKSYRFSTCFRLTCSSNTGVRFTLLNLANGNAGLDPQNIEKPGI